MSDERGPQGGDADQPAAEAGDTGGWSTSMAVPVLVVAVAIGLIGAIIIVSLDEQDAGTDALSGTSVEGPLPVTVPYRDVAGAIVIDVTFGDGSRTVPMILDTGAPTIVSETIADVFAGEAAGTIAGASADGQVVTNDVVPLSQVAIGEAVFRDVGAVVAGIEPGNPFYCITDAGFIGASLMQAATWQIDPLSGTVTIAASVDDLDVDRALSYRFERATDVSASPLIEVPVGDGQVTFLVDTGSDGWLVVNPLDLEGLDVEVPPEAPVVALIGTSANGPFTAAVSWLRTAVAFGHDVQELPLAATSSVPEEQGNAGTDFLSRFVLTVDWANDTLYLEPVAEVSPSLPMSAGLGWDDGYIVGSLIEGYPGNDGLVLGAEVSAIDGQPVAHLPFDDYCSRLLAGDGSQAYRMTTVGEVPATVVVAPVDDFWEP